MADHTKDVAKSAAGTFFGCMAATVAIGIAGIVFLGFVAYTCDQANRRLTEENRANEKPPQTR